MVGTDDAGTDATVVGGAVVEVAGALTDVGHADPTGQPEPVSEHEAGLECSETHGGVGREDPVARLADTLTGASVGALPGFSHTDRV